MNNNNGFGLGSGFNGQFTFLDMISLMSFTISMMNYGENLTQNDKQDLQKELTHKAEDILKEIHAHLQEQDKKINYILNKLEELSNDSRSNI